MELPEPHRAVEITPENWIWPECISFEINGQEMFCADVFRATGTTFVRVVSMKHLDEFESRRYVEGNYLTASEWVESQAE